MSLRLGKRPPAEKGEAHPSRRSAATHRSGRIQRLRYRLWWTWAKMRLGSDVLIAAGYKPPR